MDAWSHSGGSQSWLVTWTVSGSLQPSWWSQSIRRDGWSQSGRTGPVLLVCGPSVLCCCCSSVDSGIVVGVGVLGATSDELAELLDVVVGGGEKICRSAFCVVVTGMV
jgi:hypothetical protein